MIKIERNFFMISMKELQQLIKKNKDLKEEDWNKYAKENCLFNSFTLKLKTDSKDFEKLKKKVKWY